MNIHTKAYSKIFLGFDGGVNFSTLKVSGIQDLQKNIGFHSGILFNSPRIIKHLSIMTSVTFSTRGFSYVYKTTTNTTTPDTSGTSITSTVYETAKVKANLGYIDIPLLLCFYPFKNAGLFIQGGPQISILVTDKATVTTSAEVSTNGQQPQPTNPTLDNSIGFNKRDFSTVGGIGYIASKFMFYFRASKGFSKVQKTGVDNAQNPGNNVTYQAGLAFSFF